MKWRFAAVALLFGGCVCTTPVGQLRYSCNTDADCVSGFVCFNKVCTPAAEADAGPTPDAGPGTDGGCDAGTNTQTDIQNCGGCGNVCPTPVHAAAICVAGVCARGPCQPGFYDLDGPVTFGCESTCTQNVCNVPDGGAVVITTPPLPEQGIVFNALATGSSYGGFVQTNTQFTNIGILGESTPPAAGGTVHQTNSQYINVGGFSAAQQSK